MRIVIDDTLLIGIGLGILGAKIIPPKMRDKLLEAASRALVEMSKPSGVSPAKEVSVKKACARR